VHGEPTGRATDDMRRQVGDERIQLGLRPGAESRLGALGELVHVEPPLARVVAEHRDRAVAIGV